MNVTILLIEQSSNNCYTDHRYILISLNGITRSRFIGYNLSLSQHPFISAAKLQNNYQIHPKN